MNPFLKKKSRQNTDFFILLPFLAVFPSKTPNRLAFVCSTLAHNGLHRVESLEAAQKRPKVPRFDVDRSLDHLRQPQKGTEILPKTEKLNNVMKRAFSQIFHKKKKKKYLFIFIIMSTMLRTW